MRHALLVFATVLTATAFAADVDTVISYDDGIHRTWWCSDRDSFGAAVRFTPSEYPCEVIGARAEVGYDEGCTIYLRVYDDDSTGGLPNTILYNQLRTDIPRGQNLGFRDYDLTVPVVIDSGDFYLCFFQKHWFHLLFGTDTHFDYPARQWWYFPDWGWVTPMGMDAADHLLRAKVRYGTGVEEVLGEPTMQRITVSPNPVRDRTVVRINSSYLTPAPSVLTVFNSSGRQVLQSTFCSQQSELVLSLRSLAAGVYQVRVLQAGRVVTQPFTVVR